MNAREIADHMEDKRKRSMFERMELDEAETEFCIFLVICLLVLIAYVLSIT